MKTSGKIGLAIVDVDSYVEEAFEFIEYIKSSLLYHVPVILLTSDGSVFIKQKISQLNVDHFFVKPFNPLDLVNSVSQILSTVQSNESKV